MNQEKDPSLKDFFHELRMQDEQLFIPPFPELKKKNRSIWWIPASLAATLLLGAFFLTEEKTAEPAPEVFIITLEEGPDQELQFHIQETNEMDIWESPTASLLTDY